MSKSNFYPRAAALTVALAILAACDGSGGGVAQGIQSLGPVFQQAFGQGPNDTPIDISNAGLQVDLTAEPFAL